LPSYFYNRKIVLLSIYYIMDVIEKVRRESIERAFINLINEMSDE
jgi:hypothetical protein